MTPHVDVITVLWKSAPFMEALFDGLARVEYPRDAWTMHFVDNGPGDGSLEEVKRQMARLEGKLPTIEIHEPGTNTGFSGGNNLVMRKSIDRGHAYCYLLNPDAAFEEDALREAVAVAEADPNVGSVQSLIVLQQNPEEVNSSGNAIHFLGFGYCAGYHEKRTSVPDAVKSIAYGSGAGVLFKNSVLGDIGLLDETLFMYHEDMDLGWRILISGHRNVLAPRSVIQHRYEFSRSIAKWYWMERNRLAVVIKNYRWLTLIVLAFPLLAVEIATILFSFIGGWWREKFRAMGWFFTSSTWAYLLQSRGQISRLRKIPDRLVFEFFTPVIAYQEFESPFMTAVANPLMRLSFAVIKLIVRW